MTRKNVQVNVKHFLPGSLAVCEEEVYSFAIDPALIQRCGNTLRHAKHLRAIFLIQLRKVTCMSIGRYKRVSGIDRLYVHKSRAAFILINQADFKLSRQYLAKYAVIRLAHKNTGSANLASTAAEAFSTSACSELPCASMVTMAGKSVTRSRHIASGMPNSSSFTSRTSSMHLA